MARLAESLRRYERALAAATSPTPPVTRGPFESTDDLADALLEQGMLRGGAPKLRGPLDLVVVDDDLGGPYPPGPSDWTHKVLGPERVGRYDGGSRVVLAFAEPRAMEGPLGFRPCFARRAGQRRARRRSHRSVRSPRLVPELPSDAPVLLAWHRQRLMQDAVGRWLRRKIG